MNDLGAAVRDAKQAAGDRNVLVHGASLMVRLAVTAGLLDELEIHVVPVLLGDGWRLFEHLGMEQRRLVRISVREGERGVTHLRYRVSYRGREPDQRSTGATRARPESHAGERQSNQRCLL